MADESFASRRAAMDYLAAALPRATAENPVYKTLSDGSLSKWLTHEVRFGADAHGATTIDMRESYTQEKGGKTVPGTHQAAFSLGDVEISEATLPGDVTPDGKPAQAVMIACVKPGCVAAVWSGQKSQSDKTDIYIHDGATRAKILAALRYLKTGAE